ncbi:MAG: hypothetical protein IJI68_08785 [Eggerthellaceae bacterium]|nr:hypothetical protein [Eggerthellaceae bacterium]
MTEKETAASGASQPQLDAIDEPAAKEVAISEASQSNQETEESACFSSPLKADEVISLMNIYHADWMHRDNLFWKQAFAYFLGILAVSALPFINIWDVKALPLSFPLCVFPIVGLFLSVGFLCVMLAYCKRVKMSRDSYIALSECFQDKYRPKSFDDDDSGVKKANQSSMARNVACVMFGCLMAVSIASFVYTVIPGETTVSSCCTCDYLSDKQ